MNYPVFSSDFYQRREFGVEPNCFFSVVSGEKRGIELTIYSRTVLILGRVKNKFYIYHHKQVVQRYINSLRAASLVDAQFQANSTVIVHSSITTISIHFTNQRFVTNTAFPRNDFKNSTSGSISPSSPSSSHVIRHQTNPSRVIQRNPNEEHTQRKTHREDKT